MKHPLHIAMLAVALLFSPVSDTAYARAQVSANEAAEIVRERVGGKVLAVETLQNESGLVYRIKILTRRAEVRVYHVDAQSGAVYQ